MGSSVVKAATQRRCSAKPAPLLRLDGPESLLIFCGPWMAWSLGDLNETNDENGASDAMKLPIVHRQW